MIPQEHRNRGHAAKVRHFTLHHSATSDDASKLAHVTCQSDVKLVINVNIKYILFFMLYHLVTFYCNDTRPEIAKEWLLNFEQFHIQQDVL